jgi:hypothetical protein
MKESKHGGQRIGAGRPKAKRPLVKHTVYLYKDQLPVSSEDLRKYIDEIKKAATN